jgi:hypothetical protein
MEVGWCNDQVWIRVLEENVMGWDFTTMSLNYPYFKAEGFMPWGNDKVI